MSTVPTVIDINDVALLLGMTRGGAYKLVDRESTFPAPYALIKSGRVWDRDAVKEWALAHGRTINE